MANPQRTLGVHQIDQGEGGEQGDPLMPLLFCIGQHPALAAVAKELREGEKLFACLDDLHIICQPDRGRRSPCSVEQGSKVLGVPLGHPEFVDLFLQRKIDEHKVFPERIPIVQAAWLILSCCPSTKLNNFLRVSQPRPPRRIRAES